MSEVQVSESPPGEELHGPTTGELTALLSWLSATSPVTEDADRIDRIAAMERLKHALCAAQATETVLFKASQLLAQQRAGARRRELGRGITEQVALARRESPGRTGRLVGLAEALVLEMPATLAALRRGDVSEWRALQVAQETAFLTSEQRTEVDATLAPRLPGLSDRECVTETQRIAYRLDPRGFVSRGKKAHADRHVSMRPAPDTMARFSALLPVQQAAALYAALVRAADSGRAMGDDRTRGQLMADTLVERVTGQSSAEQVPVEVQLVMTDRTLFGFDELPAMLAGYGPIPAGQAREWLRRLDPGTRAWLRRLYTDPVSGRLSHLDTRRRLFQYLLRVATILRDQQCRTPWCSAPIRHVDHCVPAASGGAGVSVTITTLTGHTYESVPPPGSPTPAEQSDPGYWMPRRTGRVRGSEAVHPVRPRRGPGRYRALVLPGRRARLGGARPDAR